MAVAGEWQVSGSGSGSERVLGDLARVGWGVRGARSWYFGSLWGVVTVVEGGTGRLVDGLVAVRCGCWSR